MFRCIEPKLAVVFCICSFNQYKLHATRIPTCVFRIHKTLTAIKNLLASQGIDKSNAGLHCSARSKSKLTSRHRNIAVASSEKSPEPTEVSSSSNTKCAEFTCLLAMFSWLCCFITWKILKRNVHHRQWAKRVAKGQKSVLLASMFHGSFDLPFLFKEKTLLKEYCQVI